MTISKKTSAAPNPMRERGLKYLQVHPRHRADRRSPCGSVD